MHIKKAQHNPPNRRMSARNPDHKGSTGNASSPSMGANGTFKRPLVDRPAVLVSSRSPHKDGNGHPAWTIVATSRYWEPIRTFRSDHPLGAMYCCTLNTSVIVPRYRCTVNIRSEWLRMYVCINAGTSSS